MQLDPIVIDGTTYNLTLDDVREYILKDISSIERKQELSKAYTNMANELYDVRRKATDFFQEAFNQNINDESVELERDEINEFLESIGADTLTTEWTVIVDLRVTISGVNADNQDEATEIVEGNITADMASGEYNNVDYEVIDVVSVERE